jgi:excinuclease ABC subunit A
VRQNNLKGFDLDLPLGKLIVITGLSGSGKSSLAFDTLYAEGQRRYIETFTPYARQFFDRMDKPAVDRIENIPPAIAIEQRNAVRTTRSTVGTMTEVCDHLKVLWPHVAKFHCKKCGQAVRKESPQVVWEEVQGPKSKVQGLADISPVAPRLEEVLITFDLPLTDKLPVAEQLALLAKQGFQRLLIGEQVVRVDEATRNSELVTQNFLTVVADRVRLAPANRSRFVDACEQAYHFGRGKLSVREDAADASRHPSPVTRHFSSGFHCATCDLDYQEPTPALFSFNHPVGACPACKGFGRIISIDLNLALPDRTKTLAEGVVKPWQTETGKQCQDDLKKAVKKSGVPMHVPFHQLSAEHQRWVMEGDDGYIPDDPEHSWPKLWYGVKGYFRWLESKAYKMHVRVLLSRYRSYTMCPTCAGKRFNPDSLQYRLLVPSDQLSVTSNQSAKPRRSQASLTTDPLITDHFSLTLADFYALPIRDALALIERLNARLTPKPHDPLGVVLGEVRARLGYLVEVGLGYLTLDRATRTLSGGETERVNLTTCLGTRLVNALFVLDEPSVGLHPRDTDRLVRILHRLRDAGNTVVVVEHEASVMRAADQLVDIGPGHGATGGRIVFQGGPRELAAAKHSLTAAYLSGTRRIEIPKRRPVKMAQTFRLPAPANILASTSEEQHAFAAEASPPYRVARPTAGRRDADPTLRLEHATAHNLRDLAVEIPLGRFVVVTGVSGSGKTTLIREVLLPLLQSKLSAAGSTAALAEEVDGESLDEARAGLQTATLTGAEHLGAVVLVDQTPLGRTPRSNPGVYIGAFEDIRDFFAASAAARERGLDASAFSFNSVKGQCERCRGAGFEKIEMQFLSDIFIRCPECHGRRYREHILEVKVQSPKSKVQGCGGEAQTAMAGVSTLDFGLQTLDLSWSIADLLDAPVEDALAFLETFNDSKPAQRAVAKLRLLCEVGLGYLHVGQPINTLSGGEAQRLKLVSHLAESVAADATRLTSALRPRKSLVTSAATKPTLFLFDEPTTGLHFDDVRVLLAVFQRLVDAGHTVLVIEHNLDVIQSADWVIDLGPDAGEQGGQLVAAGTPEAVARCEASHTGCFLREILK